LEKLRLSAAVRPSEFFVDTTFVLQFFD
jgi:hypothetical protein